MVSSFLALSDRIVLPPFEKFSHFGIVDNDCWLRLGGSSPIIMLLIWLVSAQNITGKILFQGGQRGRISHYLLFNFSKVVIRLVKSVKLWRLSLLGHGAIDKLTVPSLSVDGIVVGILDWSLNKMSCPLIGDRQTCIVNWLT